MFEFINVFKWIRQYLAGNQVGVFVDGDVDYVFVLICSVCMYCVVS
jgi:hypothetical protein